MHTSKHKAHHHPLFASSLCSPIKFFIGFINPISARVGVLVWFYSFIEIFEYLKWSRNKHQKKCNQRILFR